MAAARTYDSDATRFSSWLRGSEFVITFPYTTSDQEEQFFLDEMLPGADLEFGFGLGPFGHGIFGGVA